MQAPLGIAAYTFRDQMEMVSGKRRSISSELGLTE